MKLTFIHPAEKVKLDYNGNYYTDGSYSEDIWNMYLKVFSSITLIMRKDIKIYSEEEAKKKFNIIPLNKIQLRFIPNQSNSVLTYLNPRLKKDKNLIIEEAIKESDAVILRIPGYSKGIDLAKQYKKPYLVEAVGCPWDTLWNHSIKGKILAPLAYFRMRQTIRSASNVIYVTSKFLQHRYPNSYNNIGCSDVRLKSIDHTKLLARIKQIQESQNSKLVIGTAGGVGVKYKGQQYIIKALYELQKNGCCDFEYQIAGNGDSSYLQSLVDKYGLHDCVKFVGSIPHDNIFTWFSQLDIYVQPSKTEGLPRALVEAMSCATPSMGSIVGGIPELLSDEVLFKAGNIQQIKSVLLKMRDRDFRIKQAELNFNTSQNYQVDILEKKRIEFMQKVFLKK